MKHIEALYAELDHLEYAEGIITRTIKAVANDIAYSAANEPDIQTRRRTVLSDMAHKLRLSTNH